MPLVDAPILFSDRTELKDAIRQSLKQLGEADVRQPQTPAECVDILMKNEDALLVLDWSIGSEGVNLILGSLRRKFKAEVRRVFLVVPEIDDDVIATGYEYGVSRVHAGPISPELIQENLAALMSETGQMARIAKEMGKIAHCRYENDWQGATKLLAQLCDKFPDVERIKLELAENYIHDDLWVEATELLESLTDGVPPGVRALHLLGRCSMKRGDFDKAIGFFERAKVINPHNVERLIELGHAFIRTDQIEEAIKTFGEAVRIDPASEEAKQGKGKAHLMADEVNEGLALLNEVSGPREIASIFNSAAVLTIHHGRFPKGMELYQAALSVLGKNDRIASRLMFNMGLGYKRQASLDKAAQCFRKAVELDPAYHRAERHQQYVEDVLSLAPSLRTLPSNEEAKEMARDMAFSDDFGNDDAI